MTSMDKLRVADRCDTGNCGAQARVRMQLPSGILDFCQHHHRAFEPGLAGVGAVIVDDTRDELTQRPGASV